MTSSKPASATSTLGRARKSGAIHVCPLSAVPHTVARSKASHLLTWLQDEIIVETPRLILPDRHIRFHIHDISEPLVGYAAPGREHIDQLIEFAPRMGRRGPDRRALLGRHQPLDRRRLHGAVRHQSRCVRGADRRAAAGRPRRRPIPTA